MMKLPAGVLLICTASNLFAARAFANEHNALLRTYRDGEQLTYQMKGTNERWQYEIEAHGIVKKDSAGNYFEEYRWANLVSANERVTLPPASLNFRQRLSLDTNQNPVVPDLTQVDARLIGPITDLMTFYADLWLAEKTGKLAHAGDHFYFKRGTPNSWADGNYVVIGEDSIDVDLTLKQVNRSENVATLFIRHLPPEKPEVRLPAGWMHKPVANTPNNWVQVQKTNNGKYLAAVGKETFDVEIKLSLSDGKILSGSINNPVETIERECDDAALTTVVIPSLTPSEGKSTSTSHSDRRVLTGELLLPAANRVIAELAGIDAQFLTVAKTFS
jgi:hypothetical protein